MCSNQTGKNGRHNLMQTYGCRSVKENLATVFGTKTASCLTPLNVTLGDEFCVEGFVSKPGYSLGKACQLFYVNGRSVDMPKFSKLLNDVYKSFNSQRPPMAVLNFILPASAYDINVTPDKRKVFIHAEGALLDALRQQLEGIYSADEHTYVVRNTLDEKPREDMPSRVGSGEAPKGNGNALHFTDSLLRGQESMDDLATAEELAFDEENGSQGNWTDENDGRATMYHGFTSAKFRQSPRRAMGRCLVKKLEGDETEDVDKGPNELCLTTAEDIVSENFFGHFPTNGDDKPVEEENHMDKRRDFLEHNAKFSFTKMKNPTSKPGLISSLATFSRGADGSNLRGIRKCSEGDSTTDKVGTPAPRTPKVVQASLSTFVSCKKRPIESNDFLLRDQPVLKCVHSAKQGRQAVAIHSSRDDEGQIIRSGLNVPSFELESNVVTTSKLISGNENDIASSEGSVLARQQDSIDQLESRNLGETGTSGSQRKHESCVGRLSGSSDESEVENFSSTVEFSVKKYQLKSRFRWLRNGASKSPTSKDKGFKAATLSSDSEVRVGSVKEHQLAAATKEFERTFNKADFKRMQVLGQFNLGFILGKLEDDIYIIDQHASDEKFNYERLLKSTVLNRQPLLQPLVLELSAVEEVTVINHLETFRQNGFDFIVNESACPGQRLGLSAIPFSKNVTFGVGDVQELIALLADSPVAFGCSSIQYDSGDKIGASTSAPATKFGIRPSRVRGMLASRACRSSVMIGDALSKREMQRVVCHLADLDSPWNCPHGRPTMRHLAYLPALRR